MQIKQIFFEGEIPTLKGIYFLSYLEMENTLWYVSIFWPTLYCLNIKFRKQKNSESIIKRNSCCE